MSCGKRIAEGEVDAAFGDAERNAVGVVVRFRGGGEATQDGWLVGRGDDPPAERRQARIGRGNAVDVMHTLRPPDGQHLVVGGDVLDRDLGSELVEAEALDEIGGHRARQIEEEAVAVAHHDEVEQDLALRRQQAGEDRLSGAGAADIGRHQIVEELLRLRPADRHHAAALKDCYPTVSHGRHSAPAHVHELN